jgi:hypothetical protein
VASTNPFDVTNDDAGFFSNTSFTSPKNATANTARAPPPPPKDVGVCCHIVCRKVWEVFNWKFGYKKLTFK